MYHVNESNVTRGFPVHGKAFGGAVNTLREATRLYAQGLQYYRSLRTPLHSEQPFAMRVEHPRIPCHPSPNPGSPLRWPHSPAVPRHLEGQVTSCHLMHVALLRRNLPNLERAAWDGTLLLAKQRIHRHLHPFT